MAGEAELLQAVTAGDALAVQRELDAGTPVDARDGRGRTALLVATDRDHVEVARVLIAAGADVNAKDDIQDSPYLYAGAEGRLDILKLTMANGADLASTNRYGGTALIPAAERQSAEVVQVLIDAGVALDHVNKLSWTALLEAVLLGDGGPERQAVVKALIAAGADVNLADNDGVTPLGHARIKGYDEIAAMLVAAGAR